MSHSKPPSLKVEQDETPGSAEMERQSDVASTAQDVPVTTVSEPKLQPRPSSQLFSPPLSKRFHAGFWDQDEDARRHRRTFFKILGLTAFLISILIFGILSIYWGGLWRSENGIHNMNGWIVDFDGSSIGDSYKRSILGSSGPKTALSWEVKDASLFPNGPSDLITAVVEEEAWVIVSINPGATSQLNASIENSDPTYNGSLAVTAYVAEARNENNYALFLVPVIRQPLQIATTTFSRQNVAKLAALNGSHLQTLLSSSPDVVTQPASYTIANVRPFDIPVATAVDFVGLIYLLIISFIIANLNFAARHVLTDLSHRLRLRQLIVLRIVSPLTMYFILSWMFSLLSLAFQVPFNRRFGHSGFVIYWAMNFCAMAALGLPLEALITLLTPAFTPYFLILWLISNVTVCFFPIEILPPIYRYGYSMPFYNVSRTVRAILFSTRNQVGLNFGIQFAWIAVSLITLPLIQTWRRHKDEVIYNKAVQMEKEEA